MQHSTVARLARWRDVLVYAACGALAGACIAPAVNARVVPFLQSLGYYTKIPLVQGLLGLVLVGLLHRVTGTRLLHLREVLRYPPLPVSVVIGVALIPIAARIFDASRSLVTITFKQLLIAESIYVATWFVQVGV